MLNTNFQNINCISASEARAQLKGAADGFVPECAGQCSVSTLSNSRHDEIARHDELLTLINSRQCRFDKCRHRGGVSFYT
eukprot:gene25650-biopygen9047